MNKIWCSACVALSLLGYAGCGFGAETYPVKPVRVLIPYPPGGSSDIVARIMTTGLSEELGKPVVVDNRGGAGGVIATEIVAHSVPDGYTLLHAVVGQLAIAPHLYRKLAYDPFKDFSPVSLHVAMPLLLVATPSLPAGNLKEFLALAKASPGKLNFSSSGNGGSTHLSAELLKIMGGIDMVHVVYKGAAPSIAAVMANEVSVAFDGIASALPHVKSGRLKALGISIRKRSAIAPNIPTIDEAGVKGFDSSAWMGMVAPRGTPDAVIRRLNEAANKVLTRADSRKRLMDYGAEPLGGTPAEFGEFIRSEYKKWGAVVAKTSLKKE